MDRRDSTRDVVFEDIDESACGACGRRVRRPSRVGTQRPGTIAKHMKGYALTHAGRACAESIRDAVASRARSSGTGQCGLDGDSGRAAPRRILSDPCLLL